MNLSQKLEAYKSELADRKADRKALVTKAANEDRTFDATEKTQKNDLEVAIKALEEQIQDVEKELDSEQDTAVAVKGAPSFYVKRTDKDDEYEGQSWTRIQIAKTLSHLSHAPAGEIAERMYGKDHKNLISAIKADVNPASVPVVGNAAEFVGPNYQGDFVSFLDKETAFGKLGLRSVPANIPIPGQGSNHTSYWVGEGKAIAGSEFTTDTRTLTTKKLAALAVVTKELLRENTVDAEMYIRDSLAESMRQAVDTAFFGSSAATNSTPAGIFNGISETDFTTGSGSPATQVTTEKDLRKIIAQLKQVLVGAYNYKPSAVWLLNNLDMIDIESLGSSTGDSYPFGEISGGRLRGHSVVSGDHLTSGRIALLNPTEIYVVEDNGMYTEVSQDATIEMSTIPAGDAGVAGSPPTTIVPASVNLISLYQNDLVGIKCVRPINWVLRRSAAAVLAYCNDLNLKG